MITSEHYIFKIIALMISIIISIQHQLENCKLVKQTYRIVRQSKQVIVYIVAGDSNLVNK